MEKVYLVCFCAAHDLYPEPRKIFSTKIKAENYVNRLLSDNHSNIIVLKNGIHYVKVDVNSGISILDDDGYTPNYVKEYCIIDEYIIE